MEKKFLSLSGLQRLMTYLAPSGTDESYVKDLIERFEAKVSSMETDAQSVYDAFVQRLFNFEASTQDDMLSWFETVKGILDEDAAGNLLLLIQAIQNRLPYAAVASIDTRSATDRLYPQCELFGASWAYGLGGAGLGSYGGKPVVRLESDQTFDAYSLTIAAPEQYMSCTDARQIDSSTYALLDADPGSVQSLLLKIYPQGVILCL